MPEERDQKIEDALREAWKKVEGESMREPGPWIFRMILEAFPALRPEHDPWDAAFLIYASGLLMSTSVMGKERLSAPPPGVVLGLLPAVLAPHRVKLEPDAYPVGHPDKKA